MEVALDRSRVIEEADDVGVGGRIVGRGAMGYLAQPPETVASFVPEVCPCGEGSRAVSVEARVCAGRGCTREREIVRPGPVLVRGGRPRCASACTSGWTGGVVKGCPTSSGGCEVGAVVDIVRVPMKG